MLLNPSCSNRVDADMLPKRLFATSLNITKVVVVVSSRTFKFNQVPNMIVSVITGLLLKEMAPKTIQCIACSPYVGIFRYVMTGSANIVIMFLFCSTKAKFACHVPLAFICYNIINCCFFCAYKFLLKRKYMRLLHNNVQ